MAIHPLDVLLIERHPGAGDGCADELEEAGHRVHRCHPPTAASASASARTGRLRRRPPERHLCTAITDGVCPLDGHIDVALLVRTGFGRAQATEAGVHCAIRDRLPLVEEGSSLHDPYSPWLAARVDTDVVDACEQAVDDDLAPLRGRIAENIAPVLVNANVAGSVTPLIDVDGTTITVTLVGPPVSRLVQQSLAVRTLEALRTARRADTRTSVIYEPTTSPHPATASDPEPVPVPLAAPRRAPVRPAGAQRRTRPLRATA